MPSTAAETVIATAVPYGPMVDAAVTEASRIETSPYGAPKSAEATYGHSRAPEAPGFDNRASAIGFEDGISDCAGGGGDVVSPAKPSSAVPVHGSNAPPQSAADLVVVWDLDETLIIFNSLLNGAFARAAAASAVRGPQEVADAAAARVPTMPAAAADTAATAREGGSSLSKQAAAVGRRLAEMVFSFCDDHMGFKMVGATNGSRV